jgi:hypothetical protein
MSAGLRALLEGVIDYAGLFPPAQLPLEPAFRHYLRYRDCPESWMLGRFIIQAAKLPELGALVKPLPAEAAPLHVSVLGRGGPSLVELYQGLVEDFKAMQRVQAELQGRIAIDGFEVRLAPAVLHVLDGDPKHLRPGEGGPGEPFNVLSMLIDAGKPGVFLEIGLEGDWRHSLVRLLERIDHAGTEGVRSSQVGVKLRCGGLDAAAFPAPEPIAAAITACRDVLVPLKFTAGLHHPLRHYNEDVQTKMHGFLNVFAAGVLAHRFHLDEEQVRQVLEDEDPRHFTFDDDGMAWKDRRVSVGEIKLARQLAVTSFGSCSFDEPREDLRGLGLLG